MGIFRRFMARYRRNRFLKYMLKHCLRVDEHNLIMYYNLDGEELAPTGVYRRKIIVCDLPYGYPGYPVHVIDVGCSGENDFFVALLFETGNRGGHPHGNTIISPVIVFWNETRGFWWEQFTAECAIIDRIGKYTWTQVKQYAKINWICSEIG